MEELMLRFIAQTLPRILAISTPGDNFGLFICARLIFAQFPTKINTHSLYLYLSDFDPPRGFPSNCEVYSQAVAPPRNDTPHRRELSRLFL